MSRISAPNKNYTHYAVRKSDGKIVNGWDYKGYDKEDLKQYKKDYFDIDLKDMDYIPSKFSILTRKQLVSKGKNPQDWKNWRNEREEIEQISKTKKEKGIGEELKSLFEKIGIKF